MRIFLGLYSALAYYLLCKSRRLWTVRVPLCKKDANMYNFKIMI